MKRLIWACALLLLVSCRGKDQKPLRVAIGEGLVSFDPHTQDEAVTMETLGNIYESLVATDVDMQLVPVLCTGYTNVSDLVWRFYLRPEVKFHNGQTLSADDVIYSLERARNHGSSVFKSMLAVISDIRKTDRLTVEVTTFKPRPNLINTLTMINIIPSGSDPQRQPVGTGPYVFAGFNGKDLLRLNKFQDYWRKKPFYDRVEFHIMKDDSVRVAGLLRGRVDIDASVEENYRGILSANNKIRLMNRPGSTITLLGMNVSGKFRDNPLSDVRIRQAISLCIDRRDMIERVCRGYAVPANQLASPFIFGYNPALPEIARDLVMARRTIQPLRVKDTIDLKVKVSSAARLEGQILAEYLKPLGIRLSVEAMPWTELYDAIEKGRAQFYLMGFGYSYGDAGELLGDMVHSRGGSSGFGARNLSGYSNLEMDLLVEQADHQFDVTARKQLLQKALSLAVHDLPFIPLYIRDSSYGLRKGLNWRQRTASVMLVKEIEPER